MAASARYARQIALPGFGVDAQERLARARVLVVGAGGLGAPVLTYLASSGVGQLTVIDDDTVTASNLARQVLYRPGDLGAAKATTAVRRLAAINPAIEINAQVERLRGENVTGFVRNYSVVIDSSDNFDTRYLLNDAAVRANIPYVWGAVDGYAGRAGVAVKGVGPCFRCLFPAVSASHDRHLTHGVFGPVCAVIGGWMAGEALAILAEVRAPAATTLVQMDCQYAFVQALEVAADPTCPTCAH